MLQNGTLASHDKMVHTNGKKSVSYKASILYLEKKIMIPVINEIVLNTSEQMGWLRQKKRNSTTNAC